VRAVGLAREMPVVRPQASAEVEARRELLLPVSAA